MGKDIETSIEIDADPEAVWEVLSDFAAYPEWNPFITSLQGDPAEGNRLRVEIHPPSGSPMKFSPTVLVWEPGRALIWRGKVLVPGLFDGEHRFEVKAERERRTTFIHAEKFSGLLLPLVWGMMKENTKAGFEAMNVALKARVEAKTAAPK